MLLAQIETAADFATKALDADVARLALVMALTAIIALVALSVLFSRVATQLNKTQAQRDKGESAHQAQLLELLKSNTAATSKLADTLQRIDENSSDERKTWHNLIDSQSANVGKIADAVKSMTKVVDDQLTASSAALNGVTGQFVGFKSILTANTAQITELTEAIHQHTETVNESQEQARKLASDGWDKVMGIFQQMLTVLEEQKQIVKTLAETQNEKPQNVLGTGVNPVVVDVDDPATVGVEQPDAGDGAGDKSTDGSSRVRDEHGADGSDVKPDAGSNPDSTAG